MNAAQLAEIAVAVMGTTVLMWAVIRYSEWEESRRVENAQPNGGDAQ